MSLLSSNLTPADNQIHDAALEHLSTTSEEDLATITLKTLKSYLEEKFGCDLTDKKSLIKESLGSFIENFACGVADNQISNDDYSAELNDIFDEDEDEAGSDKDEARNTVLTKKRGIYIWYFIRAIIAVFTCMSPLIILICKPTQYIHEYIK